MLLTSITHGNQEIQAVLAVIVLTRHIIIALIDPQPYPALVNANDAVHTLGPRKLYRAGKYFCQAVCTAQSVEEHRQDVRQIMRLF
jgi:hypothetical protein